MTKINVLFVLTLSILYYCYSLSNANFGPFNLGLKKISICKGPKRRECSKFAGSIVNETIMTYDLNVTENVKDIQGVMFATSDTKQTLKLQMKKLCQHPFWLPFMQRRVNMTADCVILKGNYKMIINVQEIAQKYYGGSFIYGQWTLKTVFYNYICNFGCLSTVMVLTPKK